MRARDVSKASGRGDRGVALGGSSPGGILHWGLFGVLALAAGCGEPEERPQPPNVLLISLDTLRADHCSVYGYGRETTPFLEELASKSVVFERAYTTCAWTLIAHMSMLTGLYPSQHHVTNSGSKLTAAFPTLAERLSAIGYRTLGVHYPGWLNDSYGFDRGFDVYESASNVTEAKAVLDDLVQETSPERPWFLFVHLFDIHSGDVGAPGSTIYEPPSPYDTMFDPDARRTLENVDVSGAITTDVSGWPQDQVDAVAALYDGGIRHVDDTLRAWFAEWEAAGLLENTIVIVTSDHGEGLRQREPSFGGHGSFFEEGLRVPLIVHVPAGAGALPALVGPARSERLTSLVDLVPTVLEATAIDDDSRLPGRSLARGASDERFVLAQRKDVVMAWQGTLKIRFREHGRLTHLTDLALNPGEERRRERPSDEERARGTALMETALEGLATMHDPGEAGDVTLSEAERARLRALGYAAEIDDLDRQK